MLRFSTEPQQIYPTNEKMIIECVRFTITFNTTTGHFRDESSRQLTAEILTIECNNQENVHRKAQSKIYRVSRKTASLRQVGINSVIFQIPKNPKYTYCGEFHSE